MFLLLLLQSPFIWAELPSKTFELPSLTIEVEQPYLIRKQPTNLSCTLSAGWSGTILTNITWLRNGEPLDYNSTEEEEFRSSGSILTVIGGKGNTEGDYQCLSDVMNITLSNRQKVNTKLVSSPVKLRRARITKFDKISEHMVSVRQGEVARLPCAGMPDVIPGPPEICFEKEGIEGTCFGEKNPKANGNFLSTSSGMQISMVQQSHHGNYFCVVKNEFTKQTRKSPKPVILVVNPPDNIPLADDTPPPPDLVFPTKIASLEKPVIIDVVQGQDILLECVFTNAKIYWMKHNDTTPQISLNDPEARVRQVWGNLMIRTVTQEDAGVYSCHGLSPLIDSPNLEAGGHQKVHYNVVVHGPTSVNLTLSENPHDKSWDLSCLATNLKYEIPMAFVNGTALVDAIDQMGVASSTNFFTNPINATMKVKHTFSGSVQCISRPAMDEAEIYGAGLDRGVSQNIFVASTHQMGNLIQQGPQNATVYVGEDVLLPCLIHRVKSKYWMKNDEFVKIYGTDRTRVIGSNTLRISNVQLKDAGWYTCIVTGERNQRNTAKAYLAVLLPTTTAPVTTTEPFIIPIKDEHLELTNVHGFVTGTSVRLQWSVLGNVSAVAKIANFRIELLRKSENSSWIEADRVDSHVRATTIKDLVPNNQYRLRVVLHREDGSSLMSNETDWMKVQMPTGDIPPLAPTITAITQLTSTTARVDWTHPIILPNGKARNFHVHYKSDSDSVSHQAKVDGALNSTEIDGLKPEQHYYFHIVAENHAGRSPSSGIVEMNTTAIEMSLMALFERIPPNIRNTALLSILAVLIAVIVVCICCVVYCNIRTPSSKKANGKFLDTSYRIFNEQKVHKSRLPDNDLFVHEDIDECSPLKMRTDDRGSLSSAKFAFSSNVNGGLPNLYGNLDDMGDGREIKESDYVSANKLLGGSGIGGSGIYGNTTTARCYSPDSGTSHEMIVPYTPNNMRGSIFNPSPLMTSSPQRVSAYKCPDSLLYSPAGTASSIADTSSSGVVVTRNCDSPSNPQTDGSDQGIRCGGSSRNSQVSSDGGRAPLMSTFKANTNSFIGTLDRRGLREQLTE